MARVRFQMFLDEKQRRGLERLQEETKLPMGEIVRKAIDGLLAHSKERGRAFPADETEEDLISVIGVCKGGPRDLADRHDQYLSEERGR
jgi:hypothetical protein